MKSSARRRSTPNTCPPGIWRGQKLRQCCLSKVVHNPEKVPLVHFSYPLLNSSAPLKNQQLSIARAMVRVPAILIQLLRSKPESERSNPVLETDAERHFAPPFSGGAPVPRIHGYSWGNAPRRKMKKAPRLWLRARVDPLMRGHILPGGGRNSARRAWREDRLLGGLFYFFLGREPPQKARARRRRHFI